MYDPDEHLEVYVKEHKGSKDYREYEVPSPSPSQNSGTHACYIEAVDEERFAMGVRLLPGFDLKGCSALALEFRIDGQRKMAHLMAHLTNLNRELGEGFAVVKEADYFLQTQSGERYRCAFVFGRLKQERTIDDESELSADEERRELRLRGKIDIVVQRGEHGGKTGKLLGASSEALPTETSKKVIVDNGKSHGVKPMLLSAAACDVEGADFIPGKGEAGKKIRFTFHYTSRMYLEQHNILSAPVKQSSLYGIRLARNFNARRLAATPQDQNEVSAVATPQPLPRIASPSSAVPTPAVEARATLKGHEVISISSDDEEPPLRKKVKAKIPEDATPATVAGSTPSGAQSAKARERAKLQLQLERIKVQERLLELED